jgi:phosphate starvation-inducible protein PhoH
MVRLLGPQDRLIRAVEGRFPDVRVHVRGNEVTFDGEREPVAAATRLVEELVRMTAGEHATKAAADNATALIRAANDFKNSKQPLF